VSDTPSGSQDYDCLSHLDHSPSVISRDDREDRDISISKEKSLRLADDQSQKTSDNNNFLNPSHHRSPSSTMMLISGKTLANIHEEEED
jgi:hypothetical protein